MEYNKNLPLKQSKNELILGKEVVYLYSKQPDFPIFTGIGFSLKEIILAAVLVKPQKIKIESRSISKPQKGEALLKVKSVGICGSDVHYYRDGGIGGKFITEPIVLGHELSAEVVELGPRTEGPQIGQLVAVEPSIPCMRCEFCLKGLQNLCRHVRFCGSPPQDGAFREYMVYPVALLYPLPQSISADEGAVIETLAVSYHALSFAGIAPGESVAILGSGSIGLTALQVGKIAGATTIIATDVLDYRLEVAKKLGAQFTFNASTRNVQQQVLEVTDGRGVDVVVEAAGAMETPQQAIDIAAPAGRVVLIGKQRGSPVKLDIVAAQRKEVRLFTTYRSRHATEPAVKLVEQRLVDLKTIITHRFALQDIEKAFKLVSHYRDRVIKAVINP